jgi:hypothetical protein
LPLVVCGLAVSVALLSRQSAGAEAVREPARLNFDTDIGNEVDDAMALCMIHSLASRGECQPLAVTIAKDKILVGQPPDKGPILIRCQGSALPPLRNDVVGG